MISDFQRNGWVRDENLRLPEGTDLHARPHHRSAAREPDRVVRAAAAHDLFRTGAHHRRGGHRQSRARRRSTTSRCDLDIDGRTLETTDDHGAAERAGLGHLPAVHARAAVHARHGEDRRRQAEAGQRVSLRRLARTAAARAHARCRRAPRAKRACTCRRRSRIGTTPAFQVDVRQSDNVSSTDLDRHRVVILNDTAALSSGEMLKRFVSQGGGLLVVLGEHAVWGTDSNDLLPGVPGNVVDRTGRGGSLAELDYSHPILELFKAPRSGNLSTARFFRYRGITMKPSAPPTAKGAAQAPAQRVIARFDDGAVAMAERTIGSGHVILWSSTLDNYWNDLALEAGVSAVRPPDRAPPRDLRRAAELVHRRRGGRSRPSASGSRGSACRREPARWS